MAAPRKFSPEERRRLFAELEVPFDPALVKWRVIRTAKSGRRGAVLPFADPRAYTDRFNHLFSPTGWSFERTVTTIPNLTRRLWNGRTIATGKIIVSGTVSIHRLANYNGNGEAWADKEQSVSSAEAQALRRACIPLGLGRYLYWFRETWISLDRRGEPIQAPSLPEWALPPGVQPSGVPRDARGPLDHQLTAIIEGCREHLGEAIYGEILARAGHSHQASLIPNAALQKATLEWMKAAARGFEKAHRLVDAIGQTRFVAITDSLGVSSMTSVPNLETLRYLVDTLEASVHGNAA
jgi:hypothetical protein